MISGFFVTVFYLKNMITFRKAMPEDAPEIWRILQQAILKRKEEGSDQWQDGYPNPETVRSDIEKEYGYVLETDGDMAVYSAVILNNEPAYEDIEGAWLSEGDFIVVHRIAAAAKYAGRGFTTELLRRVEVLAKDQNIYSIRADTNFDNPAMLAVFRKMGYTHCGEVQIRGAARLAFEKLLK